MAPLTVYIHPDKVTYSTDPLVFRNESVIFQLVDRNDIVTVNFGSSSPFSQNSFVINGGAQPLLSQSKTVAFAAPEKKYPFSAGPTPTKGDPEPPGTVGGDLEVVTDPKDE
jgi:hypothetical protein